MINNLLIIYYLVVLIFNIIYLLKYIKIPMQHNTHLLYLVVNGILIYGMPFINLFLDHNIGLYSQDISISILIFFSVLSFYLTSIIFIKETLKSGGIEYFIRGAVFLILVFYIINNFSFARWVVEDSRLDYQIGIESFLPTIFFIYKFWIFPILLFFLLRIKKIYNTEDLAMKVISSVACGIIYVISVLMLMVKYDLFNYQMIHFLLEEMAVFVVVLILMSYHMNYEIYNITDEVAYSGINKIMLIYRTFLISLLIISFISHVTDFTFMNETIKWFISMIITSIVAINIDRYVKNNSKLLKIFKAEE